MIAISSSLIQRIIRDFSYLSASWPDVAENSMNGRMKTAPIRLTIMPAVDRRVARGLERDEHDERVLEDVVVGRAEKLRPEERREAALAEQRELARDPGSVHRGKLSGAPGMVGR